MTKAMCFMCSKELDDVEKSMEELVDLRFPVFCSLVCSSGFPDNGTELFNNVFIEIEQHLERENARIEGLK